MNARDPPPDSDAIIVLRWTLKASTPGRKWPAFDREVGEQS